MKTVKIELREWDHTCGDGCCYTYGTELYLNGERLEDKESDSYNYVGDDVGVALKTVLERLGYDVEMSKTHS